MNQGVRFIALLGGIAGAAVLLWLAARTGDANASGYAVKMLLVGGAGAALGLGLALAALIGIAVTSSRRVGNAGAVLAVLLALVAGIWVIAAHAPEGQVASDLERWSSDLGVWGLVNDLEGLTGAIALGLGVLVGVMPALLGARRSTRAPVREVRHDDAVTTELPRRRAA